MQNNKTNNKRRNDNQGQASPTQIAASSPDSSELNVTRQPETDKKQRHTQASNNALVTTAKEQNQTTTTDKTTKTTWGHQIQTKALTTIHIVLQNIGGIDMMETGSIKLTAMRNFINKAAVDICTITECNINWKNAPKHLYSREQTCYWWENSHWSVASNHNETNKAAYQPGGTALVVLNQLSHQAQ